MASLDGYGNSWRISVDYQLCCNLSIVKIVWLVQTTIAATPACHANLEDNNRWCLDFLVQCRFHLQSVDVVIHVVAFLFGATSSNHDNNKTTTGLQQPEKDPGSVEKDRSLRVRPAYIIHSILGKIECITHPHGGRGLVASSRGGAWSESSTLPFIESCKISSNGARMEFVFVV